MEQRDGQEIRQQGSQCGDELFGWISARQQFGHDFKAMITTNSGDEYLLLLEGCKSVEKKQRLRLFTTVRFMARENEAGQYHRGKTVKLAREVEEWREPLVMREAPGMLGKIIEYSPVLKRGRIQPANSMVTLSFRNENLAPDSVRPMVNADVVFNTKVVYGKDSYTEIYRISMDQSKIDESRAFVCPAHVAKKISLELSEFNIYVGDFDHEFERETVGAFFTLQDFFQVFVGEVTLEDFPVSRLIEWVTAKYYKEEQVRSDMYEGKENRAVLEEGDKTLVRVRGINRALRNLGHKTKPSILVNPLPFINDQLGSQGKFVWSDFAGWINGFFSGGESAKDIDQVFVIKGINGWITKDNFVKNMVSADFESSTRYDSFFRSVLLGSDLVNFGAWNKFEGKVEYRHSNGLLKVAVYCFSAEDTEHVLTEAPGQLFGSGLRLGEIDVQDVITDGLESASAAEVRNGPAFKPNDYTFVWMYNIRAARTSFLAVVGEFKRVLRRCMVPWEVPPAGYEAFLVTPKDEGHSKEIIGKLTDPRHKGMFMVMPASLTVDVGFVWEPSDFQTINVRF